MGIILSLEYRFSVNDYKSLRENNRLLYIMGFPDGARGKETACQWGKHETWVQSLGWEDSLEEGMATHSSILAWRIPWMEEFGGLWFIQSQRVGHDWSDLACMHYISYVQVMTLEFFLKGTQSFFQSMKTGFPLKTQWQHNFSFWHLQWAFCSPALMSIFCPAFCLASLVQHPQGSS